MKLKAAIALFLLSTTARADLKKWPEFKLALAGDQKVITQKSLTAERNEFEAYKTWLDLIDEEDDLKNELTHARHKYERYVVLAKTSTVTMDELAVSFYDFSGAQNKLSALPFSIQKARAELEFWREDVLAEGNPGSDHRKELLEAELEARSAQALSLKFDLATASVGLELAQKKVENSEGLLKRKAISKTDMEDRVFLRDDFADKVESTRKQIETLNEIVAGLEKDLEKLKDQTNQKLTAE